MGKRNEQELNKQTVISGRVAETSLLGSHGCNSG